MKIFLSGANGMVGKNILESPASQQHQWLTPSRSELDLNDFAAVKKYFKTHQPDFVIHAAARVGGIQANIKNPVAFLIENLDIGRNIILAAKETGVQKLLNLGSSCMYPKDSDKPLTEDLILKGELEPTNEGYALSKIMAFKLGQYIHREDPKFLYKTIVPCNLYGRWDKFDPQHSHLLPAIIHKIYEAQKNGSNKVEIWGDGTARREFMVASDLADCIAMCLQKFEEIPEVMNVGLGFDYSINEYYEAAKKVIGYKGEFYHDLTKPVGMKRKLVSVGKVEKLGWKAKTSLEDGIQQAFQFYKSEYLKRGQQ